MTLSFAVTLTCCQHHQRQLAVNNLGTGTISVAGLITSPESKRLVLPGGSQHVPIAESRIKFWGLFETDQYTRSVKINDIPYLLPEPLVDRSNQWAFSTVSNRHDSSEDGAVVYRKNSDVRYLAPDGRSMKLPVMHRVEVP